MAKNLKRTVEFDGKKLSDVPGHSADQMRVFYARLYPELNTATAQEIVTGDEVKLVFTTAYKSKG